MKTNEVGFKINPRGNGGENGRKTRRSRDEQVYRNAVRSIRIAYLPCTYPSTCSGVAMLNAHSKMRDNTRAQFEHTRAPDRSVLIIK